MEIYKRDAGQAYHFLQFTANQIVLKEKYNNSYYNEAKSKIYNYLSVLSLGKAIRGAEDEPVKQEFYDQSMSYLLKAEKVYSQISYVSIFNRALIHMHEG